MGRRSAADKAETHKQILQQASETFRAHGSGIGIGEVMSELGLTHGGFYRHFESKDELLAESISLALSEISERLVRVAERAEAGHELAAIITAYLSVDHLRHPETWCALATLAPDIARLPAAIRKRIDSAMATYMEKLAPFMPGASPEARIGSFIVLFSGMAGAMAMTRALGDKTMRDQVLALTRDFYLRTFTTRPVAMAAADE